MLTKDIKNVQLATTGTFNASTGKVKFTRQDFDDMAAAAKALAGKVDFPLKLGHNEKQELLQEDGLPAAGWIENVRRIGNHLMVDFMRVPAKIADIMEAGGFRKRSLEAMRNVELAGTRFPFVLTGAALLGEELPAVDSLDDIAALYEEASWRAEVMADQKTEAIAILADMATDEDNAATLVRTLERTLAQADGLAATREGVPAARRLIAGAIQQLQTEEGEETEMEFTKEFLENLGLKEGADEEAVNAAIKELKDKVEAGTAGGPSDGDGDAKPDPAKDAELAELRKTVETMGEEIVGLKNDKAATAATAAADEAIKASKFAPGVRPQLIKMALSDPEGFKEYVEKTPVIAGMATGVIGTSDDPEKADLSDYEPSETDLVFMKQTGVSREEFILQAIADAEEVAGTELVGATVKASLAPKKAD